MAIPARRTPQVRKIPNREEVMGRKDSEGNTVKYYGWSSLVITSKKGGDLTFDPFFSEDYGTHWSDLSDYNNVSVICVSHGHHEHYTDAYKVASRTGAMIVAPPRVCQHLHSHFAVPNQQLTPLKPGETVTVNGYSITAFPWYHRKINYFKFFAGRFFTGCRFVLTNLLHTPLDTPFSGFMVVTPEGTRILNLSEGMNDKMPSSEVAALRERHKPDVVTGGYQLQFEREVARCFKESGAPKGILYHPHEKLFGLMKLYSTPVEIVKQRIEEVAPAMQLFAPAPREEIFVQKEVSETEENKSDAEVA
ncbi:MAG: MBL fold metallo-hydrolase [Desulfovibrio sp.]|uniref:MBL fold metallo-hydrolase n=1 Tax=Desulfovibrio sp. TaxID=885 RepID=UPI002A359383|nr:MBL fold metallo-hydrolase [Desulfovibrio sp.]MDY0259114.1 MBL fold metallo-hydrolase [Desulfovibrio sp.]